ncbi:hypothetical protein BDN70DRAFT_291358 [Pholiota conissans]|uniref:Uncharacterized protein n=1 Tax=Pholiota conissans TaxID=109636 RepID=A0A9P6D4K0_9AGAR|nr:hypothetical protein BDN70DRAFT_291358 [Pholiota conissans]
MMKLSPLLEWCLRPMLDLQFSSPHLRLLRSRLRSYQGPYVKKIFQSYQNLAFPASRQRVRQCFQPSLPTSESLETEEPKEETEHTSIPPHEEPTPSQLPSPLAHEESASRPEPTTEAKRKDSGANSVKEFIAASSVGTPDAGGRLSPPPSMTVENEDVTPTDMGKLFEEKQPILHRYTSESLASTPVADPSAIREVDVLLQAKAHTDAPNDEGHDDEIAEEEARKKRVAERIAKMGGFNPFAPPPPLPQAHVSDTTPSPPTVAVPTVASPPETAAPREEKEDASPLVHPVPVHAPQTQTVEEEIKVDEELSDEVENMEDEDDASEYETNVAQESIEHNEGFAKEPASHFDEPEPVPVSRAPPIPLSNTRPAMQVQQFTEAHNDEEETQHARWDSAAPEHSSILHIQPPRRLIPQAPEEDEVVEEDDVTDEEADERLAQSQLFVPPPRAAAAIPPPRRQSVREEEEGDGNESDSTPALPYLQRRSVEVPPPARSPSPPSDYDLEPDSDHDGKALPIPPRNVHGHGPPARSAPPPPPPPPPPQEYQDESEPEEEHVPVRRSLSHRSEEGVGPVSSTLSTPTFSVSGSEEILDEEEGDPIDPGFHSPSRRTSAVNLHSIAQAQAVPSRTRTSLPAQPPATSPPPPSSPSTAAASSGVEEREEVDPDSEQLRRRTIAERMAKLGGIKFGAAPPVPVSRPPPPPPQDENEGDDCSKDGSDGWNANRHDANGNG